MFKYLNISILRNRAGAVVLPVILIISAIIMEIALVAVIISTTLLNSATNEKLASEALKGARAGIQDAAIRVVRYCSISDDSTYCPSSYTIAIDSQTVTLTIGSRVTVGSNYTRTITATGAVGLVRKKLQAILSINGTTGEVSGQSISEISL